MTLTSFSFIVKCLIVLLQGGFSSTDGDYDLNDSGSWMTKFRTLKPEKNRRKEEKKFKDGERRRQKEEVGLHTSLYM